MLARSSLAGIIALIFGPPIFIFLAAMALKIYLRITVDEEALVEVRSTIQARRTRRISGLEGGSAHLGVRNGNGSTNNFRSSPNDAALVHDIEGLEVIRTRQTREERIKDSVLVFTVPDNSSDFIRFISCADNGNSANVVSEMEDGVSEREDTNDEQFPVSPRPVSTRSILSHLSVATAQSRQTTQSRQTAQSTSSKASTTKERVQLLVDRVLQPSRKQSSSATDVCIICMDRYRPRDVVCKTKTAGCNHIFHKECLEEWMKKHNRCPLCRTDLFGRK